MEQYTNSISLLIQIRIDTGSIPLTPAEIEYIDLLEPTPFLQKAAVLVTADLLVIAITWISPRMRG